MLTVFFFPKKNHQVLLFTRARLPRKTCFCIAIDLGSKGGAGESTRLPSMWPGFKSQRRRHMWVEFVVGSLPYSERFFSGYSGFPLSLETNTFKFQLDLERTDTFQRVLMNSLVFCGQTNYNYKKILPKTPPSIVD